MSSDSAPHGAGPAPDAESATRATAPQPGPDDAPVPPWEPVVPRTLDRLWSGWRTEYVSGVTTGLHVPTDGEPSSSVFTRILAAIDAGDLTDESAYVVARGQSVFSILNAYPYGSGHVLVLPYREVATLEALTAEESEELWAMIRRASAAIRQAYEPGGVNVGLNIGAAAGAGIPTHLHAHVLPRWASDTNFMATIAEARVLPESLPVTFGKLRDAWPS